jgi:signal transduction histidine kinase
MTVISANAQILREEIVATHPYYGSVELIDRASERASRIVRNLLDFSRADEFEFVKTDLNLSLQEAVSLIGPQVRRSGIEISLELDPQLPLIWASPDHLHVVWLNLLLNARDAIQESDRKGQIRVISRLRDDQALVQVYDNGRGIPPDEINRIYDPFFTTKPPGKGTGLGLFTCYRTIHRHGGEIGVDSQVGIGTSFTVVLPTDSSPSL